MNSLLIDLGSTNICIKINVNGVMYEKNMRNSLFKFGPDIMTRIGKQNADKSLIKKYQKLLLADLKYLIKDVFDDPQFDICYIAGNPAMVYFLCSKDSQHLGVYPFKAEILSTDEGQLIQDMKKTGITCNKLILVPFLGNLVGSDIYSCFYHISKRYSDDQFVLVDIGTNAEMIAVDKSDIFVASAAAGPAFGYKGSNLVSDVAAALRNGLINSKGELSKPDKTFQLKIRNFQMAKSAIKTGLELLVKESNLQNVPLYIAGLFGEMLNSCDLIDTGMIPDMFTEIRYIGNASLKGIEEMLADNKKDFNDNYCILPLELANHDDFNVNYIRNMNF